MAMTAGEREQVLAEIAQCLEIDIHSELMAYFAQAVSLTETYPEQVNNELRNAITHFSRAYVAGSLADARIDLSRAKAHVDRAKRDCLKLSIILLHDRIQNICAQIKAVSGTIDPAFVVRRNLLTAERSRILTAEINGIPGVTNDLLIFIASAESLDADLTQEYHIGSKLVSPFSLFWMSVKTQALGFAGGVVATLVFGVIFALAVPHPENLRADILKMFKPPAASGPSVAEASESQAPRLQPERTGPR